MEFRDYYESHHRFLGEKYLSPHALKYIRRYPILVGDGAETPGFDVMMEVWFDNYYSMEAAMADMSTEAAQCEFARMRSSYSIAIEHKASLSMSASQIWMTTIEITAPTGDCGILCASGASGLEHYCPVASDRMSQ